MSDKIIYIEEGESCGIPTRAIVLQGSKGYQVGIECWSPERWMLNGKLEPYGERQAAIRNAGQHLKALNSVADRGR